MVGIMDRLNGTILGLNFFIFFMPKDATIVCWPLFNWVDKVYGHHTSEHKGPFTESEKIFRQCENYESLDKIIGALFFLI